MVGCDDGAVMTGRNFANGCPALCSSTSDVTKGKCMGFGCCQLTIPKGLKYFNTSMLTTRNHSLVWSFNPCGYSFLGEASRFEFGGLEDLSDANFAKKIRDNVPIVLDWAIDNITCIEAQKRNDYACLNNSQCVDSDTGLGGYRCSCNSGYEGNPYIGSGCQGNLVTLRLYISTLTFLYEMVVLLFIFFVLECMFYALIVYKLVMQSSKSLDTR